MRVTLVTSGGLAAGLRLGRPPTVIDSARLDADAAHHLAGLIAAARAEPPPASRRAVPDAMTYTITVEDGGDTAVLRRSDASMTEAFASMVDWLTIKALELESGP